jgi:hypothetical protein
MSLLHNVVLRTQNISAETHLDGIHLGRNFAIFSFLLHFSLLQCISQGHHLISNHKASHNTAAFTRTGFFINLLYFPHLFRLAADKRKPEAPDTHFHDRFHFSLKHEYNLILGSSLFHLENKALNPEAFIWPRPLSDDVNLHCIN